MRAGNKKRRETDRKEATTANKISLTGQMRQNATQETSKGVNLTQKTKNEKSKLHETGRPV